MSVKLGALAQVLMTELKIKGRQYETVQELTFHQAKFTGLYCRARFDFAALPPAGQAFP